MDPKAVHEINGVYWDTKGNDVLGAVVLPLYGPLISEEKWGLFGDVAGKTLLEIGCGNGQSLQYHGERNASELWGMDLSGQQIEKAKHNLASRGLSAQWICAPMEEECGIPVDYFDYVYSIYAIGWTTDLDGTFGRIASYLKKDGAFIFSWSHPIHKCVVAEEGTLRFAKSYFDAAWYTVPLDFSKGTLTLSDRTLSTYVNALAKAGLIIEQMIEEPDEDRMQRQDADSDFVQMSRMIPRTFVVKARKL